MKKGALLKVAYLEMDIAILFSNILKFWRSSTKLHAKEFTNLLFYKTFLTQNLNWKYPTFVLSYFWSILLLNTQEKKRKEKIGWKS